MPLFGEILKYDSPTQIGFRSPAVASLVGNAGGLTLKGSSVATDPLNLDSKLNIWNSIPDSPGGVDVIVFDPTFTDSSGGASINVLFSNPNYSNSGTTALSQLSAVKGAGNFTYNINPLFTNLFQLFVAQPTLVMNAAGVVTNAWTILSQQSIGAASTVAAGTTSNFISFSENSQLHSTGNSGSARWTNVLGYSFALRMNSGTGGGTPSVTTIDNLIALNVANIAKTGSGTNTVTNQTAINIADLTGGVTNRSLRSQGTGAAMWHAGLATFGADSAPDTTLHLKGSPACVTFDESTGTPSNPTADSQMRVYMRADKFIIQFNNGGTVRYKYLDLTGTGVTWVHSTTAPT